MIKIRIISYEELEDHDGRIYTVYNVHVDDKQTGNSWYLRKRYKHFSFLHSSLKDVYPEVEAYRFPNKSMFNTFSQHTKERRRSGFEEFLRLIISLDPMPPEMKDFLELDDHRDSQPISPSTSTKLEGGGVSTPSRKRPQSVNSVQKAENKGMSTPSTPTQSGSQKPEDYIPFSISTGASAPATPEQAAKQRLEDSRQDARRELRNILLTTFTVSSIVYALCVFTGIVDVTDTSPGRILLTALSLGSTFSLLRISMIKREIRKRERLASTESAEEW
mmetsp:Transcript_13519/g.20312  ORF Transcript_13519/g.20312 Transcript_13519/m.20312 type:complete len:276 (-) Transcript_13519:175-1002(-)|eukprot:CAMPEP_0185037890 /NCGR_PEP_ID=MMETSP1103-20130426/32896_1 /TAXON_ID=36769 /ORGANISM="Paraphysomonas bandaiensis, Strain Caron Lab Isolate" /LENGTH=275 /DNA_ID=CAMNT_0027576079 /DNA_START=90 /DNA_END=914 /DNA_ORIENTATION=+